MSNVLVKKRRIFNIKINQLRFDEILFILGIFLILLSQFLMYYGSPYIQQSLTSSVYEQLGVSNSTVLVTKYMGFILIVFIAFLNINNFIKNVKHNRIIITAISIVCIFSLCHFVYVVFESGFINSLYFALNPIVYFLIIAVFIGGNERLVNIILKINVFVTFFSLLAALLAYISFKSAYPKGIIGNSAFLTYYIQGLFSAFVTCYKLKNKIINYLIIGLCVFLAFCGSTRSFIIQSILFLIIYAMLTSKRKILSLFVITLFSMTFLMFSLYILKTYFVSTYDYFVYKMFVDTRSQQYIQLFEQINFLDVLMGKGYYYQYLLDGKFYSYIDNAYVFLLIRYGFFFTLSFIVVLLVPFFTSFFSKNNSLKKYSLILLQVIMALGGLSVYFVIGIDYKFLLIYIIIGYCLTKRGGLNGK